MRVLLVDDRPLVRTGFAMILGVEPDLVVGEAGDGEAAVAAAVELSPDVVLMDVQMPGTDGTTATRAVVARTTARVLVLATSDGDDELFSALEAGASGFLLEDAEPEELVAAVRVLAGGGALLAPAVTRRVIERFASRPARAARSDLHDQLTTREREVLVLVARGLSNTEIATAVVLGEATVETHLGRVLSKLGLHDRVQAVVTAGGVLVRDRPVPGGPRRVAVTGRR